MKHLLYFSPLVIFVIAILIFAEWNKQHPWTCEEKSMVDSIISVDRRTVELQLMNGKTISLYEPTVKPGESVCVKWERK
jgi:hypothetical protein